MLRLGRRGIVLSLFINSLNIALYLIIVIAACLNIVEASVNFIILNAFAAAFAGLLIVSEIRLPQLTYEYFRFLCTYRGRGMTYLFFGCLVASPIPFNLYGGIVVVCMGLAFFMLSFVTLIPPLDGFILNYKKLDQWKEQKHFRVQLEAQRIFEQQLQQEQHLARMIPAHHPNAMTFHGHLAMGSPKQTRFGVLNTGSGHFMTGVGTGAGVGTGTGSGSGGSALTSMFSSPMPQKQSTMARTTADHDQFPHHQLQAKIQGSTGNMVGTSAQDPTNESVMGRGKGRLTQGRTSNQETSQKAKKQLQGPLQLDKSLPHINTTGLQDVAVRYHIPTTFALSSPPNRRPSAALEPGSPALQYLNVGQDEDVDHRVSMPIPGNKMEWYESDQDQGYKHHFSEEKEPGHRILKSAPHPLAVDQQQRLENQPLPLPQPQPRMPLRMANKPIPPHDPFRKTSLTSKSIPPIQAGTNAASALVSAVQQQPSHAGTRLGHQSLYQPPEPPRQNDGSTHPLQPYPASYYYRDPALRPGSTVDERKMALTATGRILSTIGGMSGCYAIAEGVSGTLPGTVPSPTFVQPQLGPVGDQNGQRTNTPKHQAHGRKGASARLSASGPPDVGATGRYMPDIVLTLPTPAEGGHASRREEYFAVS